MQITKVDVNYEQGGKPYSFNANRLSLKVGDKVVVDTSRGEELGYVVGITKNFNTDDSANEIKNVLRVATQKDLQNKQENAQKEEEIKIKSEEFANELKLDMKITSAELNLDRSKVVINFTSDNRVDFRELVKMLANTYKMRIELHQIGARVETQVLGGLGPCGLQVCCNRFLKDFDKSTIKMAKNQGLSLNPTKISGLCGRLMCCLAYENNHYAETLKIMPKVNSMVETPNGTGKVIYNDLLRKRVQVKFETNDTSEVKDYKVEDLKWKKD